MVEQISIDQCFVCKKKLNEFGHIVHSQGFTLVPGGLGALCESCYAIYHEIQDTIYYPATTTDLLWFLHAVEARIKEHPDYKGDD